jgi:hypothetical protein
VRNRQKYLLKKDLLDQKNVFGEERLDPIRLYSEDLRKRVGRFMKKEGLLAKPNAVQTVPALISSFDLKMNLIKRHTHE